jgi:hypothetical protein
MPQVTIRRSCAKTKNHGQSKKESDGLPAEARVMKAFLFFLSSMVVLSKDLSSLHSLPICNRFTRGASDFREHGLLLYPGQAIMWRGGMVESDNNQLARKREIYNVMVKKTI